MYQADLIKDFAIIGQIVENDIQAKLKEKIDFQSVEYIKGFAILFNKKKFSDQSILMKIFSYILRKLIYVKELLNQVIKYI